MTVPKDLPEDLQDKAGAFVSLHKGSRLRGCIGTFLPMQMNIASESSTMPYPLPPGTRGSIRSAWTS